ncbi:DUF4065 domain-containing protein [Corynebacterium aurimucosum]|nr:DUF4065 domain-containing protein [Corynebacterium aurimucosum]UTA71717.1 DUF4065 domain-containing protein [Corynebacterium aurimucosum]WJY69963.1 hypothetical protein CAURIM_04150 [Corynebacterium aurimucosum]
MARVLDVAQYILEQMKTPVTTMKLQKLVYYSQAWNLVWDEIPLFDSRIEAWANGPVVRDLFREHSGRFTVGPESGIGMSAGLTDSEKETVDAVIEAYGNLSGQQLSDLTHSERPWRQAREDIPEGAASSNPIDLDVVQDFYGGKLAEESVPL